MVKIDAVNLFRIDKKKWKGVHAAYSRQSYFQC